jgi:hypothetical protein
MSAPAAISRGFNVRPSESSSPSEEDRAGLADVVNLTAREPLRLSVQV